MHMTPRRWAGPLVLAVASILVTLMALEGVARIARSRQGRGKEDAEAMQYMEYDPILGWRKKAGARATYHRREYTVEVAVNSHGLRDPERGYEVPSGALRLLALGDSFVEGYTVAAPQTVTQVLEAALARDHHRAEVINGGTSGYSTDQELLFYRTEGQLYSPRIVLLFFHYNDIVYNDRQDYFGTAKPEFEMGGGQLCVHEIPVRKTVRQAPPPEAAEARTESGSALVEWIRDRMWYGAPAAYDAVAGLGLWHRMPRRPTHLELRVYERRPVGAIEHAWAKTALILAALAREVEARGAHFLVVYVPSRLEVSGGTWRLSRHLYGWDDAGWDRGHVALRLKDVARQEAFPVLDLTDPLRVAEETWGRPKPYFTYDPHWTPLGHRIAAESVEHFLVESGWLQDFERLPSGSANGPRRGRRVGELKDGVEDPDCR